MPSGPEGLAVLLVDDDEDDFLITRDLLEAQSHGRALSVEWRSTYEEALAAISERRHDVYLVDVRLGERTGLDLIREAFAERPGAPVLVLTGQSDHEIDLEASALGVADYLVKQELDAPGLERSIRYAVSRGHALDDLRRSEERYALAVRAANDGLWDWDLERGTAYFSPRWRAILGLGDGERGEDPSAWLDRIHPADRAGVDEAIAAHLEGRAGLLEVEHRMLHGDGSWRWTLSRGLLTRDAAGRPTRMAGSLSDITERREAERRLQHDALHDALTGLPNRALLVDRIGHLLERAAREPALRCAVLFVDVDRFKLVNDSLGHAAGDALLVALAGRIRGVLRPGDTVARLGGDEFTVLLEGVACEEHAVLAAERVRRAVGEEVDLDGRRLTVAASIGVCLAEPGTTPQDLLRNADIAMYAAKRRGGEVVVFGQDMHRARVDRLARESALRRAVDERLLDVHYQPIVGLEDGRVHALEALARWPRGWDAVPPLEFIPIAEETGLIGPLGLHVLRTALEQLAALRADGLLEDDVSVSVNVSARHLDDPRLTEQVAAALEAAGLPPRALTLEVTESALMRDPARLQGLATELCAMGVTLHLDDFGTGWSSLAALQQFPVDALKVDRSFVSSDDPSSGVIVRSTVALAHSLGMTVVAEGIEDAGQLDALRELGCEYGQGYLLSRPLDALGTRELLEAWAARRPALPARGDVTAAAGP